MPSCSPNSFQQMASHASGCDLKPDNPCPSGVLTPCYTCPLCHAPCGPGSQPCPPASALSSPCTTRAFPGRTQELALPTWRVGLHHLLPFPVALFLGRKWPLSPTQRAHGRVLRSESAVAPEKMGFLSNKCHPSTSTHVGSRARHNHTAYALKPHYPRMING